MEQEYKAVQETLYEKRKGSYGKINIRGVWGVGGTQDRNKAVEVTTPKKSEE